MAVKAIPEGYHSVTPYLVCKGAAKAIEYYTKVFGAKEIVRMPGPEGRIMHAEIKIGDSIRDAVGREPGARRSWRRAARRHRCRSCSTPTTWMRCSSARSTRARQASEAPADMFWGDRMGNLHRSVRPQVGDRDAQGRCVARRDGKADAGELEA